MRGIKVQNEYAAALGELFDSCPKAVLAAVAVSALTNGGDELDKAARRLLGEWTALYDAGIVPQRPPVTFKPPSQVASRSGE